MTRYKSLGLAAAAAAIAISIPTALTAHADEPTPEPTTITVPDVHGSGCDALKESLPGGLESIFNLPASEALAAIPEISTFSSAISGGLNPAVNVAAVLDNGPYNVFAPDNAAFEAMPAAEFEALKNDPAALTAFVYYHMALGLLGPNDVHGKLTTQEGKQITITGKDGDLKFDDTAKVVCAGLTAKNAKIYVIDTALSPSRALAAGVTTTTSPAETTEAEATETSEAEATETSEAESTETEEATEAETTESEEA